MEFIINNNLSMNMQSLDCKVYNEAIFMMPYLSNTKDENKKDNVDEKKGRKLHIWHAGIVSYIIMDFHNNEIVQGYPKYILEHGHKAVSLDVKDISGTLKDFGDYTKNNNNKILSEINYVPERPVSFFEVYNPNNVNLLRAQDHITKKYLEIFEEKNSVEIAQKLVRAYTTALNKREEFKQKPEDNLIIYYGDSNPIFRDNLVKISGQDSEKIFGTKKIV